MCMSFTDVSLDRQELIYLNTLELGEQHRFWALRAEHMGRVLAETYHAMDTADLKARAIELTGDIYRPVTVLIETELHERTVFADELLRVHAIDLRTTQDAYAVTVPAA